ncbi:Uncharacterised protein [Segatella copri]|nr:Uncharacterised protein [Segatella copri]
MPPATMIENNAPKAMLICKIHQKGPCEPIKSLLHKNSFV